MHLTAQTVQRQGGRLSIDLEWCASAAAPSARSDTVSPGDCALALQASNSRAHAQVLMHQLNM